MQFTPRHFVKAYPAADFFSAPLHRYKGGGVKDRLRRATILSIAKQKRRSPPSAPHQAFHDRLVDVDQGVDVFAIAHDIT